VRTALPPAIPSRHSNNRRGARRRDVSLSAAIMMAERETRGEKEERDDLIPFPFAFVPIIPNPKLTVWHLAQTCKLGKERGGKKRKGRIRTFHLQPAQTLPRGEERKKGKDAAGTSSTGISSQEEKKEGEKR